MALFETRQRRLFKMIKSMADSGQVDQAATKVEQDLKVLIETPEMARELVAFLMDIGYPDLAARAGEEVIRIHRDLAVPVLRLLEERQSDFPRSFELLRTLWQVKLRQRDFGGALDLLSKVDRSAESKLFESLESAARNAERFATDRLLEGDIDRFVGWSLAQYRKGRVPEAMDTLLKAAQKCARPDDRLPLVVEWISTRKGDRDPAGILVLIRIYLAFENVEYALRNLPDIFEAPADIVTQALSVVEKDLIPLDLTTKSRIYYARLLSSAGRHDDASSELEKLFLEGERSLEFDSALRDLASRAAGLARPQLLLARFKKSRGETTAALDAIQASFGCEDAAGAPVKEVAEEFLADGLDRDETVARKLAEFMVEDGSISDAVSALCRLVSSDPEWVQTQIQKLLVKDKNSAEVLTLLAVTMQVRGRESEASATLHHLQERRDRKSREDIVQVLSRFDSLMERFPGLRRMRASVRGTAGREGEAAEDWFSLLLSGEQVPDRGLEEIRTSNLHRKRADELLASGFEPRTPGEALLASAAALASDDIVKADRWLIAACREEALAAQVAGQVAILPDKVLEKLSLEALLPVFASTGASKTAADIILRTRGSEAWRMELVSRLSWDDPPAEMLFRLRAFLAEGRIALAGGVSSPQVKDPALSGLAGVCKAVSGGDIEQALLQAEASVEDRRTSALASKVLETQLENSGSNEAGLRMVLARAAMTENRVPEAVNWLRPVITSPGVAGLVEEIASASPGQVDAPLLMVTAAAITEDFDKLRRYSSMVLDIDPGRAGEIAALCEKKGRERASGMCLAYAAELSDRHHLQFDPDELLTRAVLSDPSLAPVALERKGCGPSLKALCAIATGNSAAFADVVRRRTGLTVPVNDQVAGMALSRWRPGRDDEALSYLSDVLAAAEMHDREISVLGGLAGEGLGAWRTAASDRLLSMALDGRVPRRFFWESVRDREVVDRALEGPLGQDLGQAAPEEVSAAAGAVLLSGLGVDRLLGFGDLLMGIGGAGSRLREIASAGFEKWRQGDRSGEKELVRLLLSAGMTVEATEVAWARPDDRTLGLLRDELRAQRTGLEATGPPAARRLLDAGEPMRALEALGAAEGSEAADLRALALWRTGRRNAAISAWLGLYRSTGEEGWLARLHWALGEAGYVLDRSALERYIESRHDTLLPRLAPSAGRTGGLGLISTV
jgi:tetratricopeptide (TPR) repeat protein